MPFAVRLSLIALLLAGALALPTLARAQTAPGYEQWSGCADQPGVVFCQRSETNSGNIIIGSTNTPITKQTILNGGVGDGGKLLFSPTGGLISPPLSVPGGLVGLTGLPEAILNLITFGANQVQAQAILVGTPVVTTFDGVELRLPIRVKLINPFLKSTCSIGSAGTPILLTLITGTTAPPAPNKPITGKLVDVVPIPGLDAAQSSGNILVDNSFSAPGASGCDLIGLGLINAIVNARVGLPSAAGRNTAIFSNTTLKLASTASVYP